MFKRMFSILITLLAWNVCLWLVAFLFWKPLELLLARIRAQPGGVFVFSNAIDCVVRDLIYFAATIGFPTLVSILLFDRLIGSRPRFSLRVGVWLIWGVTAWLFFLWTFHSDFASVLSEWDRYLFGFFDSLYSPRNMVPNLLAVTMTTLPLGAVILWDYARLSRVSKE